MQFLVFLKSGGIFQQFRDLRAGPTWLADSRRRATHDRRNSHGSATQRGSQAGFQLGLERGQIEAKLRSPGRRIDVDAEAAAVDGAGLAGCGKLLGKFAPNQFMDLPVTIELLTQRRFRALVEETTDMFGFSAQRIPRAGFDRVWESAEPLSYDLLH